MLTYPMKSLDMVGVELVEPERNETDTIQQSKGLLEDGDGNENSEKDVRTWAHQTLWKGQARSSKDEQTPGQSEFQHEDEGRGEKEHCGCRRFWGSG